MAIVLFSIFHKTYSFYKNALQIKKSSIYLNLPMYNFRMMFNFNANYFFVLEAYLKYLSVDYMSKVNTEKHFTHEYVNKDLVVRRAAEFNLKINFKNRTFDKTRDEVFLILKIG